jgi:hypothetical protein
MMRARPPVAVHAVGHRRDGDGLTVAQYLLRVGRLEADSDYASTDDEGRAGTEYQSYQQRSHIKALQLVGGQAARGGEPPALFPGRGSLCAVQRVREMTKYPAACPP